MALYDLAIMTVSGAPGTGTITLGSAVPPYLSFANAGVPTGTIVFYSIIDGLANSEIGYGTYTSSGTTLTRNPVKSTNSNAAINATAAAIVRITGIASDGGDLLIPSLTPLRGFDTPINLQLNASVASNILTIAVKGNNGNDPSVTNPVLIPFRDATIANGDPVWASITGALSVNTNAVGATLGTANGVPFRLWVVAFNNAGTVVLALWQSVTGGATPTGIAALDESSVQSTSQLGGSATSAGTFYTPNGTTLSSKAFRIIGYVDYGSGLTTAGTYASAPTKIQLFGPGIKKPGDIVQVVYQQTGTVTSTTSSTFTSTNSTASITPTATPNLVRAAWFGGFLDSVVAGTSDALAQLFRGTTALGVQPQFLGASAGNTIATTGCVQLDAPQSTSSTTYTVKIKNQDNASSISWCPSSAAGASLCLEELMA